jgi:Xaa-Pro aminopeptidase
LSAAATSRWCGNRERRGDEGGSAVKVRLAEVKLPEFGMPTTMPEIPTAVYLDRVDRLRARMIEGGWDRLVVYADREHSANLSYLTGFDPRFEEAMMILAVDRPPAILAGNECAGLAGSAPVPMRVHLFQDFSLPGQPRDRSLPLEEILAREGVHAASSVGVIGWKSYSTPGAIEVPAFIVDALRRLVGTAGRVENVNEMMINAADGLRVINEVEQLAAFEYAASHTSQGVRNLLFNLEIGMRENDAVRLLQWNGMPLSCHLMLTAGERATHGLLSPRDRPFERGDRFTVAIGIWGALNCRAGFLVECADELPAGIEDYVDVLVGPYFEAVVEWYEALHVGQTGAVLHEIIERRLGDPFFGIFLNPGHQIHLDEWVNSPIAADSEIELRSGMALQVDVIPATGTDYFTTNIEDGIALADADLRARFRSQYPDAWTRIERRRTFMRDLLGIDLHPDVLPFSNIPAYLAPFLLDPSQMMTVVR